MSTKPNKKGRNRESTYNRIEIIVENFPKLGKEIIRQVQETQRAPKRINPRKNTSRHTVIKLMKIKHTHTHTKTNIKSSKGKTIDNTQGNSHKDNS